MRRMAMLLTMVCLTVGWTGEAPNDNAGLGINAVAAIFEEGNRARRNGDPRQCVNVRCR